MVYLTWQTIALDGKAYYSFLSILPAVWLFAARKDIIFLKKLYADFRLLLFLEYVLSVFPFLITSLIKGCLQYSIGILVTCCLFSFFPLQYSGKISRGLKLTFLNPLSFEWKAGIRKSGWLMLLLWILSMSLVSYPAISLVLIWIIHSVIISFYQSFEGKDIVRSSDLSARQFLFQKIKSGVVLQLAIQVLPLTLYFVFNQEHWWIILFLIFQSMLSVGFSVIVKYAYWDPSNSSSPSSLYQSLAIISFLIPFLIPVPIILAGMRYNSAIRKLNAYGLGNS